MSLAYLTDIIILLTAAVIAVPLTRFAKLGTVPGFIIAGVVVGPSALDILARGHDQESCRSLYAKGAWLAVSENLEASIALAQAALRKVNRDDADNDAAIEQFRKAYYSDTRKEVRQESGQD